MKQYQPLYLKYRPQTLGELVGQEVVTKTLSNAIKFERIVHAYLFCGPRGTGKTSSARILAKSLNCEKGLTTEPCGTCPSCTSIKEGNSLDVIEIDAASHRKVEDAEDLINRVNLGTYGSRYKVYIIDEVHMLTDHAFNALLKTLEEPPKNVIFILATTEDHKVIQTIVSRCQKLDFKTIPQGQLEEKIKDVSKKENIKIEEDIVKFISKRSNGCLRDAISLLDQVSVLQEGDKKIESSEVYTLFGTVDRQEMYKLLSSILLFEKKEAVNLAEELVKSGKDIGELLKSLLELIIDFAKSKVDPEYRKMIETELSCKLEVLDKVEHSHLLKIIDRLQASQSKLRFAISQELQFMVEIMSILDEDFLVSVTELKEKLDSISSGKSIVQKATPVSKSVPKKEEVKASVPELAKEEEPSLPKEEKVELPNQVAVSDSPVSNLDETWEAIVGFVESIPTKTLLIQSESFLMQLNGEIVEVGVVKDMFLPRLKDDKKKQEMILSATKIATGLTPSEVRFQVQPDGKSPLKVKKTAPKTESSKNGSEPQTQSQEASGNSEPAPSLNAHAPPSEDSDEFSKAMTDLLGAKKLD